MKNFTGSNEIRNKGITAIVIDDDIDTVSVLSEFLHIKGITVIGKGYDGLEAVEIYKKQRPDVIFLDVMMKDHDGLYTLGKIREFQPDAIVILITADMTADTRKRLMELDASAIIYKPYDINEVLYETDRLVLRLKQKLIEEIATKKACLREINEMLEKRLHESDLDVIHMAQYFNEKEKLV
jgi:two-component system, chemotaxis family, chemotaxis protein CheY